MIKDSLATIAEHYGLEKQKLKAIEEMAELTKALLKDDKKEHHRGDRRRRDHDIAAQKAFKRARPSCRCKNPEDRKAAQKKSRKRRKINDFDMSQMWWKVGQGLRVPYYHGRTGILRLSKLPARLDRQSRRDDGRRVRSGSQGPESRRGIRQKESGGILRWRRKSNTTRLLSM